MAPKKVKPPLATISNIKCTTRSQHATVMKKEVIPKRKAEESPLKQFTVKRSTFGDFTGAENISKVKSAFDKMVTYKHTKTLTKKVADSTVESKENMVGTHKLLKNPTSPKSMAAVNGKDIVIPKVKKTLTTSVSQPNLLAQKNMARKPMGDRDLNTVRFAKKIEPAGRLPKKIEPAAKKSSIPVVRKPVNDVKHDQENITGVITRRKSAELEKSTDSSLYVSALEDLNICDDDKSSKTKKKQVQSLRLRKPEKLLPEGVLDFDKEQLGELSSCADYAMDIFNYLKKRESFFKIDDYMERQKALNKSMRSLLVDWMVEVQENFELNHETLYLAVKLVDLYLSKVIIDKQKLQLVGCACLFVASKYDERIPPLISDYLYVCDGLYSSDELMKMEIEVLKIIDFQLGIPLSYRFLRRYARCAKIPMNILTLARYILEYTLMDYDAILLSDSKKACAALYMALLMTKESKWTSTLEYYTGYEVKDFISICELFNSYLKKVRSGLKTIRNKYSHQLFFEVAKIPLLDSYNDIP